MLSDGSVWCRLLMAKSRVAPLNRISIPQMEFNGAVLSKRCRKIIEKECRLQFEKILHFVDSETVLCQINKLSTGFQVYESVRVGEIQAATDGDVSCWGWIKGQDNIADWVTRGRNPEEIGSESEWFKGPNFFSLPLEEWNVKFSPAVSDVLPGEKRVVGVNKIDVEDSLSLCCKRSSSLRVVKWAIARIIASL